MTLDKPCLAAGCPNEGVYGRGSLVKGTMVWACPAHRDLLERRSDVPPAAPKRLRDLFSAGEP